VTCEEEKKGFGCTDAPCTEEWSEEQSDEQCQICDPEIEAIITPSGTHKYPGFTRVYISGNKKKKLQRELYNIWAKSMGAPEGYDVARVWFIDMGHGPVPKDVEL
jgi:hypothetical protein